MTLDESNSKTKENRSFYRYVYAAIFLASTSLTTVSLSVGGYISLDPLTAFVASLFAGVSFLLVQITYTRFVVNASQSSRRKPQPDIV
jgi:hypothetical protein